MRRPEWAAAGTFAEAWHSAAKNIGETGIDWWATHLEDVLLGLAYSRVITMDSEQAQALPDIDYRSGAESARAFMQIRLPFELVYLSLGEVQIAPGVYLAGALINSPTDFQLQYGSPDNEEPWPGIRICIRHNDGLMWEGSMWPTWNGWMDYGVMDEYHKSIGKDDDLKQMRGLRVKAIKIVEKTLYFLESANVELVEGSPSRQERRQVARKGGKIALTVQVRSPKRRPRPQEDEATHVDYSHRWEVRGHYKHFPVGTRLADAAPEKLVDHETLGRCRRVWCPPFVKGPQDKPLVPKIRVVS